MAKITPRLEKRKKWLEEKKNLSRVTRAQVAKQSPSGSSTTSASRSPRSSPKSGQLAQSTVKTGKHKHGTHTSQKTKKLTDIKNGAKFNQSAKKAKSSIETVTTQVESDSDSRDKTSTKKSKVVYVDAVEKLESSSSIHVPKKLMLFVGNLPEDITKEQVMTHFKRTGGVKSVKIPKHRGTDTGKGFAYIEFNSTISHRLGLRLNNTTLAGRKIVVEFTSEGKMTEKKIHEKLQEKNDRDQKMPFDT